LAGILVSKGLRAEARRRYEHSLLVKSDLQIAHKELADILCGDGEYDSAIAHYEEALRLQPDFKEAKQNLDFARTLLRGTGPSSAGRTRTPNNGPLGRPG
jgi:tetratricopeptide (TPR) repeat protein